MPLLCTSQRQKQLSLTCKAFEFTPLRFWFESVFSACAFTALTDNVLWKKDDGQIRAIVEVKKATRADLKDSLLMQEASEMVGWLKDSKPWIEFYNGQFLLAEHSNEAWICVESPLGDISSLSRRQIPSMPF
ncbi:hypothetical protein BDQ94DRAFT_173400 [Aspergillus welwitschiae]|uniref:Uncharacterized protein n=1 Tax=Aspergillus welwitschiae TaxID=1341132 RepID=A0A3F3PSJ0_9EURO|nr:hypothetical protein BDQ94DRAFT_173400 [Aspergillus welwitschiae]RDH29909.1 hypothetical protein BDQ94DRAFT_173400 [Aspergillus welwitschiae]GKZ63152.1 hypothetical protein AnigIFM49718_010884 [Aspergillus niger]